MRNTLDTASERTLEGERLRLSRRLGIAMATMSATAGCLVVAVLVWRIMVLQSDLAPLLWWLVPVASIGGALVSASIGGTPLNGRFLSQLGISSLITLLPGLAVWPMKVTAQAFELTTYFWALGPLLFVVGLALPDEPVDAAAKEQESRTLSIALTVTGITVAGIFLAGAVTLQDGAVGLYLWPVSYSALLVAVVRFVGRVSNKRIEQNARR